MRLEPETEEASYCSVDDTGLAHLTLQTKALEETQTHDQFTDAETTFVVLGEQI